MSSFRSIANCALAVAFVLVAFAPVAADHDRSFKSPHYLRGLPPIRLAVDGPSAPIAGTDVSEASLTASVKDALRSAGIRLASDQDLTEAPWLRVTVLMWRTESSYSYTILIGLQERCSFARNPELSSPFCVTWSQSPTIGYLRPEQAGSVRDRVLYVVGLFTKAYAADQKQP